jgi:hypothetical protein
VVQCLDDWNKDQTVRRHPIPVKKKKLWFELGGCIYGNHMQTCCIGIKVPKFEEFKLKENVDLAQT